jgi:hypothetical protein
MWRDEACVGSLQLVPAEAARLVAELTATLAGGYPPGAEVALAPSA